MIQFRVSGMTCDGCVRAVTRAIHQRRPNADVSVDLGQGLVSIADNADAEILSEAIEDAGFSVEGRLS
ncbi:MAG: copper chaperone [Alphaproteobacteria bacterium]|jgi:copper chaperone|nr:copper chaperone [Alphaproteobacteria bacterium]